MRGQKVSIDGGINQEFGINKYTIHKVDKQQGPTIQHRELYSISVITQNGKESEKEQVQIFYYCCSTLSCVQLLATPWTAAHQAPLSFTISQSWLKLMFIESVMLSNHLIFYHCPLLLLPSIFPGIRVFSNELALCIRWSKYWSFSFSISPSNEY